MTTHNALISPLEVASWLISKTSLTFEQIAKSTKLNVKEVEFMANKAYFNAELPMNPIEFGVFSKEDIEAAEKDPSFILQPKQLDLPLELSRKFNKSKQKKSYSLKKNIPNCACFMIQNVQPKHEIEFTDSELAKLLSSTKTTIEAIRQKINQNEFNEYKIDPVGVGLCSQEDFDKLIDKKIKAKTKKKKK